MTGKKINPVSINVANKSNINETPNIPIDACSK